ncbi:MAG: hypothetical protein K2K45_06570 [Muribaculaceae bacterium]|nr:hypothetical protein [Muribaculaceae bacterium]MDE7096341.1 hypothetical protein [Muribaculaceae bacterium]
MITNKHEQIISDLLQATSEGKIEWQASQVENEFYTMVGDYRISIYKLLDDGAFQVVFPDTVCAEMSFIDSNGDTFDHISTTTTKSADYQRLSQLHDAARRSSTGADKKLNDIISILQK